MASNKQKINRSPRTNVHAARYTSELSDERRAEIEAAQRQRPSETAEDKRPQVRIPVRGQEFRVNGEALNLATSGAQPTTLERCTNQQGENFGVLMEISRRINSMAVRLQGYSLTGSDEESGCRESEGLLGDHLHALEVEAHLLGSLLSDLDQIEALL